MTQVGALYVQSSIHTLGYGSTVTIEVVATDGGGEESRVPVTIVISSTTTTSSTTSTDRYNWTCVFYVFSVCIRSSNIPFDWIAYTAGLCIGDVQFYVCLSICPLYVSVCIYVNMLSAYDSTCTLISRKTSEKKHSKLSTHNNIDPSRCSFVLYHRWNSSKSWHHNSSAFCFYMNLLFWLVDDMFVRSHSFLFCFVSKIPHVLRGQQERIVVRGCSHHRYREYNGQYLRRGHFRRQGISKSH